MYARSDVVDVYRHTFAARLDVFSAWTPVGWRPRREELSVDVALAGLAGTGPPISCYTIDIDSASHLLAVDFDTDEGESQARTLAATMAGNNLPAYVETSRRGAHLWCILDWKTDARLIRRGIRWLMGEALLPEDPHIELRPGSDEIREGGLGHAIRMPLMPHPKTGKRGEYSDAEGTVFRSLSDVVLNTDHASASLLASFASRYRPVVSHLPREYREHHEFKDDGASASSLLISLWGVTKARPGIAVRCPAHERSGLGPDRTPSLHILREDNRVLCYTPGCLFNNDGRGRGTYELTKLANSS